MVDRTERHVALVEAVTGGFPVVGRRPPKVCPPRERSDEPPHGLAQSRIAEPELAMLGLHRLDEPLGQSDGHDIPGFAPCFQPYQHQRDDRRQHGEPPVERVRNLPLDVPVRRPRDSRRSLEQGIAASWVGR